MENIKSELAALKDSNVTGFSRMKLNLEEMRKAYKEQYGDIFAILRKLLPEFEKSKTGKTKVELGKIKETFSRRRPEPVIIEETQHAPVSTFAPSQGESFAA